MAGMEMLAGDTLRQVVRAVLDATVESIRTEEPLFEDVSRRMGQHITEFDIVYAIGWLAGLADACDRGIPRRIV